MMIWKEEYSIGVDLIDKQHKYLFEIGNNAYKMLREEKGSNQYKDILLLIQDLFQYAKYHFQTEEEYMQNISYKDYLCQKEDHDNFIQQVDKMNQQQIEQNPQKYIEEILVFIFNWLVDHILLKDKLINE
jgi:hemerythrin